MKRFNLNVSIEANTPEEADAKLHLLMRLGAFFSDYDIRNLTGAFIYYQIQHYLGKLKEKDSDVSFRPKFRLKKRA